MHLNNTKVVYLRKTSSIVVHCKSNEAMPSSNFLSSRTVNMCGNEPELSKGRMYVTCVPTLLSTLHCGTYPLIMCVTASLLNLISFEILRWYPVPRQIYKTSMSLKVHNVILQPHKLSSSLAVLLMIGMSLKFRWVLPPNEFYKLAPLLIIMPCDQIATKA